MGLLDCRHRFTDQPALADSGRAGNRDEAGHASFENLVDEARECLHLGSATNERSDQSRDAASRVLLFSEQPSCPDRFRFALERKVERLAENEPVTRRVIGTFAGKYRVRLCFRLETSCDVDSIA